MARDWRQHPPVTMQIGPVLHIEDAVASKVAAMVGRGLPRLAPYRDPGLRVLDVADCMKLLDRLPDAPFADYLLTDDDVRRIRRRFQDWPRDPDQDHEGRRTRALAHQTHGTSAASLAAPGFPTPLHDMSAYAPAPDC